MYELASWSRHRQAAAAALALALIGLTGRADAQTLLSQGRPTVASSAETAAFSAANAVDGSTATRWSSLFSDPQWIYVDLGSVATVTRVVLNWEAAFGRAYQVQVSNDASAWTTLYTTTTGTGGINDLAVSGSGRYVRMNGTQRGTAWGYSLWEFQVYGTAGGGQAPYGGTARAIPGTIQAEHYDTGGEGVAYHDTTSGNSGGQLRTDGVDIETTTDTGGGQDVGWTAAGEWLEYTVNVGTSGSYTLEARVASLSTGGTLHVEMDGGNVSGIVTLPSTGGWQNWTTVSKAVTLSAGPHVMRLALDSGGFNVNWLRFTGGTPTNCTTLPSVPTGLGSPSRTSNSVSLSWNASTPGPNCTVLYRVFRNGTQVTQISTTSTTVGGLAANTQYSFSVAAVNEFGSSAQSSPISVTTSPGGRTMEVMTWVPSYSQATWKAALQANTGGANNPRNTLTRIGGQFWQVQSNGTTVLGVPASDVTWTVNFAHANGIKFLICVHNYVNGWNWGVAASAFGPNRTALVNHLAGLVTQWGADGVDVDFEGNLAGDPNRAEFAAFIRELGTRLHSMGKELTVDIFPYIWNQPAITWIGDWVGYADGINSMGYDGLSGGGCGEVWQPYRYQQDTVLAAGYRCDQFDMGMPGWTGTWGCGGLGTNTLAHVNELRSGSYNRFPTSVAIWDAQFNGAGWLSPQVWDGLKAIRMSTCP